MSQELPISQRPTDVLAAKPKPRFFDKRFWTGFGAGVVGGFVLVVGALIIFALIMSRAMRSAERTAEKAGARTALPAPPFPGVDRADYGLKLEGLDGTPFDAGTLQGKVAFLNFWATWCGPCREEMPTIQRLYDKVKGGGVVFLAISDENRETLTEFVKKNAYTLPIYRIIGTTPETYRTEGIPATFILAPDGRIAFKHVGSASWDDDSTFAFLKTISPPGR